MGKRVEVSGLSAYYGRVRAVEDVSLTVEPRSVTAFIGPSGCGKSTLLRTLNRMHEVTEGASVQGSVRLDDEELYAPGGSKLTYPGETLTSTQEFMRCVHGQHP